MPTEVILPKVDMDMAKGQISRWFRKEGDTITKGEPLFEIETDKAAMEVDAPVSGILRDVVGAEGVDIDVGSPVAWIYAEGEAPAPKAADPARPAPPAETQAPAPAREPLVAERRDAAPAKDEDAASCRSCDAVPGARNGVRATPLARRLARENGIDLAGLAGGGPHGRVQRDDVERAVAERKLRPDAAPATSKPSAHRVDSVEAGATSAGLPQLVRLREGEGVPLILIHGFGSESASWRPLLAELKEGNPVLGIDLAGHGASVACTTTDFIGLVAGVEDALAASGQTSCHLVGHSLGGAVATAVAAGVAIEVRSLALLAPAGFGPDIDTNFIDGFAGATEEAPIRSWLRYLTADPASLSDGFIRATARARADGRHADAQRKLARQLFSGGTQCFEVRSLLRHLAMPVKILAGTDDRVVPPRHYRGLPGMIGLHLFPNTGHLPQIERASDVGKLLNQFVRP